LDLLALFGSTLGNLGVRKRAEQKRLQLEAQYYQAQKMEAIGQLTAGIAHDFNNLLTVINGSTELLLSDLEPASPHQESLRKVLHAGQRAADLVRQLLAFSRRQVIEPQVLNLNIIVNHMERMLQRIIGENIALETILAPELWQTRIDLAQMEQVIINLAVNARDAMPEGGRLTVETANIVLDKDYTARHLEVEAGEYVLLIVSDTGIGMDEYVKAHIFEPFFTTKEVNKGTGLGLATVFGIVKQNGGSIWVYSEPGTGTTFKIYLPRIRADKSEPLADRPIVEIEPPSGRETILLVEDDPGVRDLVRRVLQGQGYLLLETQNSREAQDLVAHRVGPIDLLLTDVIMPGISGKALADQLIELLPDLKVLFISGYTDNAIAHHGVLDPDVHLLQKPFTPMDLARKVRMILDG
jgi:nitrogen-specific signal transduction histidine kinase